MKRRSFLKSASVAGVIAGTMPAWSVPQDASHEASSRKASGLSSPENILLKDYKPKSIYKIPITDVPKAKFPVIDMHSHPYAKTAQEITEWVRNMDEVGVEKTMILAMATGEKFSEIYKKYSAHLDRFEVWCGFDYTGYDQPGFSEKAVKALEQCHDVGARGVGELHDKGKGLSSSTLTAAGMHPDDARMDALFERCGQLGMPVSIHVADPIWMYQPMDNTNDGLMNAYHWRLDNQPGIVKLSGMVDILERTVKKHGNTTFIVCHFANLGYDLTRLGQVLDAHPNLYADIAARYAETAPIPRFTAKFYEKHADRLVYGTDMGVEKSMYQITFRILETEDEHFYENGQFGYHWSLNGFGLSEAILRKLYHENAEKLLASRKT